MNAIESPSSTIQVTTTDLSDVIDALRSTLPSGNEKITGRIAELTARRINQLAIMFPTEKDDVKAFHCVALMGLAITKGCKEAVKRKPKLTRWAEIKPPSLQILINDQERKAALKLLSSSKFNWSVEYALSEAIRPDVSKSLLADLTKWAIGSCVTSADLLKGILLLEAAEQESKYRLAIVMKQLLKLNQELSVQGGDQMGVTLRRFVNFIETQKSDTSTPPKFISECLNFLILFLDQVTSRDPGLLLDEEILSAICDLRMLGGDWSKAIEKPLIRICNRIVSISVRMIKAGNGVNLEELRELIDFAMKFLPIEKSLHRQDSYKGIVINLVKGHLIHDRKSDGATQFSHEFQEQVTSLMSAWDRFNLTMPEVSTKGEIAAVINQLAAKLCLERFGTIGDVVVFQPLQHFLEHQEGSPPRSVRIKESGIRAIRPDQSSRVLLRAIVSKT